MVEAKMCEFSTKKRNPQFDTVMDIEAPELQQLASQVQIIDVRQPDEYTGELGHIESAELIVLDTLPENLSRLSRSQPIVFVCRSGGRSARAADFAFQNGFQNAYNMEGGMIRWNQLGLPITK